MIKEGDIPALNQLTKEAEDSYEKLKEAYEKKDSETFNIMKKNIIQAQRKISQILAGTKMRKR